MKDIWLVEYCEDFDDNSPFILKGAFATEELAAEYIDAQSDPENYYTSKTVYYEKPI